MFNKNPWLQVDSNRKCRECSEATVLIVDDVIMNIEIVACLLRCNFDLRADYVMNGQEAVDCVKANLLKKCCAIRYKLVIMDYDMPVMNGVESSIEILKLKARNNTKLFLAEMPESGFRLR